MSKTIILLALDGIKVNRRKLENKRSVVHINVAQSGET